MSKQVKITRVLCLMDYRCHTGFGSVSKHLVRQLRAHFPTGTLKLDICAINYFGELLDEDADTTVFSAQLTDVKKDPFGRFAFAKVLDEGNYDGIFIMQDLGVIAPYIPVLKAIKEKKKQTRAKVFKSVFYFPVDRELAGTRLLEGLNFFDTLITYNEWSKGEILRRRAALKGRIKIIPHGIDTSEFFPIDPAEVLKFRELHFGVNAKKMIINATNRNQPRKDIPGVIFAFEKLKNALYCPERGVFLYLHMNPLDPKGHDLRQVLAQTSLREGVDYAFPPQGIENHGADTALLNQLYNASDVYLTMNRGEGWGLTVHEAMACKLPVVAPLHTSLHEIGGEGERIWALRDFTRSCDEKDNAIRPRSNPVEAAQSLFEVLQDREEHSGDYQKRIDAAFAYATSLNWETVGKQWVDVFRQSY